MQIVKRCGKVGCREFTENSYSAYCKIHKGETDRAYNEWRNTYDKEYVSFYKSTAWTKKRLVALRRDEWICRRCSKQGIITVADMVDHIVPSKVEWELRLDIDNLQALCNECHAIKTAEDKVKYKL